MEYKDFVEQVKEKIQDFLPEKFADASVTVHQVVKNNDCVLDGLTIRTEESNISPTVYLNPYFEQIPNGAEMDDVLVQIAATYQAHYIDHIFVRRMPLVTVVICCVSRKYRCKSHEKSSGNKKSSKSSQSLPKCWLFVRRNIHNTLPHLSHISADSGCKRKRSK